MATYKLHYKAKLSKKQAIDKICAHAMFGNHYNLFRPQSVEEVQRYFLQKGINTNNLTEQCRNPHYPIPDFENLIGAIWHTTECNVSLVDSDGAEVFTMNEPGLFHWSNYRAHFEAACDARDRAVSGNSFTAFQECLSHGFASIDAFFNAQAEAWNKQHPDDILIDSKKHKVNLESKIDQWLPKMSGGRQLDKSGQVWNNFKILERIRDNSAIHPKLVGEGISYKHLAKQINTFRLGIAQLLANLHLLLGLEVPSAIINAIYIPDAEVVLVSEN